MPMNPQDVHSGDFFKIRGVRGQEDPKAVMRVDSMTMTGSLNCVLFREPEDLTQPLRPIIISWTLSDFYIGIKSRMLKLIPRNMPKEFPSWWPHELMTHPEGYDTGDDE